LEFKARPVILRVVRLKGNGAAELTDAAGKTLSVHVEQLAPCHLPDLNGTIDRTLLGVDQDALCEGCGEAGDPEIFMFCDSCNQGWHTTCHIPKLREVPEGMFLCSRCRAQGITEAGIASSRPTAEQQQQQKQGAAAPQHPIFQMADAKRRDGKARELHGRICTKRARAGKGPRLWGRVNFTGAGSRPTYFKLCYADGTIDTEVRTATLTKGVTLTLQPIGVVVPPGIRIPAAEPIPGNI
jgi:hypothetical protein